MCVYKKTELITLYTSLDFLTVQYLVNFTQVRQYNVDCFQGLYNSLWVDVDMDSVLSNSSFNGN